MQHMIININDDYIKNCLPHGFNLPKEFVQQYILIRWQAYVLPVHDVALHVFFSSNFSKFVCDPEWNEK